MKADKVSLKIANFNVAIDKANQLLTSSAKAYSKIAAKITELEQKPRSKLISEKQIHSPEKMLSNIKQLSIDQKNKLESLSVELQSLKQELK